MGRKRRSQKRPYAAAHQPIDWSRLGSVARDESGPDGRIWQVQHLRSAAKSYTCPACGHLVEIGAAHVVAWPVEDLLSVRDAVQGRRHWHSHCWARRLRPQF